MKDNDVSITQHKHKIIPLGSVISLIGPRGSGKSFAVKDICFYFRKEIPRFVVVSKTARNTKFFTEFIAPIDLYYDWKPSILHDLFDTQDKIISKYGKNNKKTQVMLILDDCLCDKKIWKDPNMIELLMNGRHKNITFIFTSQYPIGIGPELRANIDFLFVYSQESISDKKKIHEHYAGVFDKFQDFKKVFDHITEEYRCMVINRKIKSNSISKKIYWYKAPYNIPSFRAGDDFFWNQSVSNIIKRKDTNSKEMSVTLI